jgi:lysophospholipase L1-like esterase
MLECLIIGDSIAVGIGQYRPDCVVEAKVGINSRNYVKTYALPESKLTVISLGSNDLGMSNQYTVLYNLRSEIKGTVLWVLPANNDEARSNILTIASIHNDKVADIRQLPLSKDGVHPTTKSYEALAKVFK